MCSRIRSRAVPIWIALVAALTLLSSIPASATDFAFNIGGRAAGMLSARAAAMDAQANTYVAGLTWQSSSFEATPFTSYGQGTMVVAKLDAGGAVLWAKGFGGTGAYMRANAMAIDPTGGVVIAGEYELGDLALPSLSRLGRLDGFAMRLDANGNLSWAHAIGGPNVATFTNGVAVDSQGVASVTGSIGDGSLTSPPLTPRNGSSALLIRIDPTGAFASARSYSTGGPMGFGPVAVDAAGNLYVGAHIANGTFAGTSGIGVWDMMVLKIDRTSGNVLWANRFGGPGADVTPRSLSLDAGGNVFVAAELYLASLTVPPINRLGTFDIVAMKLDSTGALQWARGYGGAGVDARISGTAVTASGHLLIAGLAWFTETSAFTNPALTPLGRRDALLFEIDGSGSMVRADHFGGPNALAMTVAVGVDANDNRYVVGNVAGDLMQPPLVSKAQFDSIFGLKADASGTIVRATNYIGTVGGDAQVTASASDAAGNLYIAGTFAALQVNIGGKVIDRVGTSNSFVAAIDPLGSAKWAKAFGIPVSPHDDKRRTRVAATSIAIDANGNVWVGGATGETNAVPYMGLVTTQDGFVTKLASTGSTTWTRNFTGDATTVVNAVESDGSGGVIVAGEFQGGNLATPAITRVGVNDAFVTRLDANGNAQWLRSFAGTGAKARARALAVNGTGSVFLAAGIEDANLTSPPIARLGARDALIVKLDANGQVVWTRNFGGGNGSASAYANAIAVAPTGKVYVAGHFDFSDLATPPLPRISFYSQGMAIALDSAGAIEWARQIGSTKGFASAAAVALDAGGDVFVGGNFSAADGWLDLPGLAGMGVAGGFLFRYDAAGNLRGAGAYGGPDSTFRIATIAADHAGAVYAAGSFSNGSALVSPALTLIGVRDGFVMKRDVRFGTASAGLTVSASSAVHFGQKTLVTGTLTGTPLPTGAIMVSGDGRSCTIYPVAGTGSCLLSTNGIGVRNVSAHFVGDDVYAPNDATTTRTVKSTLDVDDNGHADALTDGALILRYAFGLRDSAMTANVVAQDAARTSPAAIAAYIAEIALLLDVDGDGRIDALTDGVAIIRYLFGLRGDALVHGVVGAGATRTTAVQIEAYLETLLQ